MGRTFIAVALLPILTLLTGCGPKKPPVRKAEPVSEAPGPRCSPQQPNQPSDTSAKLRSFKQDLSRCLLMGERLRGPTPMVFVLQVAEDGSVREAEVAEGSPGRELETCANEAMRALTFEPFCGSDVELRWRIQVQ